VVQTIIVSGPLSGGQISWQGLNRAHVDAVLAQGITGVATYDPAEGWTVSLSPFNGGGPVFATFTRHLPTGR
jgi:hypothetical protein